MTPQRLPKVPPPTTWIDTSLLWFDLIAYPRILLCPVPNSTWPKLVWNCPCLHMFTWGTCIITASNTSFLRHRAKPNAGPSRTLEYKALWYYARNRNPASQPDREILWMVWQPRCWPTSAVFGRSTPSMRGVSDSSVQCDRETGRIHFFGFKNQCHSSFPPPKKKTDAKCPDHFWTHSRNMSLTIIGSKPAQAKKRVEGGWRLRKRILQPKDTFPTQLARISPQTMGLDEPCMICGWYLPVTMLWLMSHIH